MRIRLNTTKKIFLGMAMFLLASTMTLIGFIFEAEPADASVRKETLCLQGGTLDGGRCISTTNPRTHPLGCTSGYVFINSDLCERYFGPSNASCPASREYPGISIAPPTYNSFVRVYVCEIPDDDHSIYEYSCSDHREIRTTNKYGEQVCRRFGEIEEDLENCPRNYIEHPSFPRLYCQRGLGSTNIVPRICPNMKREGANQFARWIYCFYIGPIDSDPIRSEINCRNGYTMRIGQYCYKYITVRATVTCSRGFPDENDERRCIGQRFPQSPPSTCQSPYQKESIRSVAICVRTFPAPVLVCPSGTVEVSATHCDTPLSYPTSGVLPVIYDGGEISASLSWEHQGRGRIYENSEGITTWEIDDYDLVTSGGPAFLVTGKAPEELQQRFISVQTNVVEGGTTISSNSSNARVSNLNSFQSRLDISSAKGTVTGSSQTLLIELKNLSFEGAFYTSTDKLQIIINKINEVPLPYPTSGVLPITYDGGEISASLSWEHQGRGRIYENSEGITTWEVDDYDLVTSGGPVLFITGKAPEELQRRYIRVRTNIVEGGTLISSNSSNARVSHRNSFLSRLDISYIKGTITGSSQTLLIELKNLSFEGAFYTSTEKLQIIINKINEIPIIYQDTDNPERNLPVPFTRGEENEGEVTASLEWILIQDTNISEDTLSGTYIEENFKNARLQISGNVPQNTESVSLALSAKDKEKLILPDEVIQIPVNEDGTFSKQIPYIIEPENANLNGINTTIQIDSLTFFNEETEIFGSGINTLTVNLISPNPQIEYGRHTAVLGIVDTEGNPVPDYPNYCKSSFFEGQKPENATWIQRNVAGTPTQERAHIATPSLDVLTFTYEYKLRDMWIDFSKISIVYSLTAIQHFNVTGQNIDIASLNDTLRIASVITLEKESTTPLPYDLGKLPKASDLSELSFYYMDSPTNEGKACIGFVSEAPPQINIGTFPALLGMSEPEPTGLKSYCQASFYNTEKPEGAIWIQQNIEANILTEVTTVSIFAGVQVHNFLAEYSLENSFQGYEKVSLSYRFVSLTAPINITFATVQVGADESNVLALTSITTHYFVAATDTVFPVSQLPGSNDIAKLSFYYLPLDDTPGKACIGFVSEDSPTIIEPPTDSETEDPIEIGTLDDQVLSLGRLHSCFITATGAAKCFGNRNKGRLGDGTTANGSLGTPVQVQGIDGSTPSSRATALSLGAVHSCVLLETGEVRCFGNAFNGRLGNGAFQSIGKNVPVQVQGIDGTNKKATAITSGRSHSCALIVDGSVNCWGENQKGQLGNGSIVNSAIPVQVEGIDGITKKATAITSGDFFSCALLQDKTVNCWGKNNFGQLGNGNISPSSRPTQVQDIDGLYKETSAIAISSGADHSCLILETNALKCFGNNQSHQLTGTLDMSLRPIQALQLSGIDDSSKVISVSAGGFGDSAHTCVVTKDKTIKCWGAGSSGQLGNGTNDSRVLPVQVSQITNALTVAAGGSHSCSVLESGEIWCWGANSSKQLGRSDLALSSLPGRVGTR